MSGLGLFFVVIVVVVIFYPEFLTGTRSSVKPVSFQLPSKWRGAGFSDSAFLFRLKGYYFNDKFPKSLDYFLF